MFHINLVAQLFASFSLFLFFFILFVNIFLAFSATAQRWEANVSIDRVPVANALGKQWNERKKKRR